MDIEISEDKFFMLLPPALLTTSDIITTGNW